MTGVYALKLLITFHGEVVDNFFKINNLKGPRKYSSMLILHVKFNSRGKFNLSEFRRKLLPLKKIYFQFFHINKHQDMYLSNTKENNKIFFLGTLKQHLKKCTFCLF
jgi:hypothetical protein